MDDNLRDKIAGNPNVTEFRRMCVERGMVTLREDGFKKVAAGQTTVDEIKQQLEEKESSPNNDSQKSTFRQQLLGARWRLGRERRA